MNRDHYTGLSNNNHAPRPYTEGGYSSPLNWQHASYDKGHSSRPNEPSYEMLNYRSDGSTYDNDSTSSQNEPSYERPNYRHGGYTNKCDNTSSRNEPSYERPIYRHGGYTNKCDNTSSRNEPSYERPNYRHGGYTNKCDNTSSRNEPSYERPNYRHGGYTNKCDNTSSRNEPSYERPNYRSDAYTYNNPQFHFKDDENGDYVQNIKIIRHSAKQPEIADQYINLTKPSESNEYEDIYTPEPDYNDTDELESQIRPQAPIPSTDTGDVYFTLPKRKTLCCGGGRCFQISLLIILIVSIVLMVSGIFILLKDESGVTETTTTEAPITECWSTWGTWSPCDRICGEGVRSRTRECQCDTCIGRDSESEKCNEAICPRPEYGEWTTWSAWTACSKTCDGGSEKRRRVCEKEHSELDCKGQTEQVRECNMYDCPVCNRTCPDDGYVGPGFECKRCICNTAQGLDLSGTVTDTYNIPLVAVIVSDSVWPSEELGETDADGNFNIDNACVGIELRFDRVGYVTLYETIEEPDVQIYKLNKIDLLHMDSHPEDRLRIIGESVKFCCTVVGSPPPDYYEWLFNGQTIDGHDFFTNEIELQSLVVTNTGEYQCRAVNDYSAVTSYPASLNVQEQKSDFCETSPQTFIVEIEGCKEGEMVEVDVGICEPLPCHPGSRDASECGKESGICCGPVKIVNSQIKCDLYMLPVYFVAECGCMECPTEGITIRGVVLSLESGQPIPFALIFVDGIQQTSSDKEGSFLVTIDDTGNNLNLVIAASHQNYVRTMKEIVISEPGSIQTVALVMFQVQDSLQIESSDDAIIPLTVLELAVKKKTIPLEDGNFGNITVPANSFLNMSGTEYNGPVNASLTNIDVHDINQMLNCPGELNFVNGDGEKQPLHTFTMFSLSFIDSIKGEPLQLKNEISITLRLPYDPTEDPFMFSLNEDKGIWQYLANLNKNISTEVTVSGKFVVSQEYNWISVSSPISKEQICYSKIRIFESDSFKKQVEDISSIRVVVDDQSYNAGKPYYGEIATNRAFSDSKTNYDGYCIAHSCQRESSSKQYHASLFVEYSSSSGTSFLNPAIENTGIAPDTMEAIEYTTLNISNKPSVQALLSYNLIPTDNTGPYYDQSKYDWKSSPTCSSLPEDHFRFYIEQSKSVKCAQSGSYTVQDVVAIPPPNPSYLNNLAWFGRSERLYYDVCYIKIMIESPDDVSFRAFSKVGNLSYGDDILPGQSIYGFRDKCQSAAMCLEIKHSGKVYDNSTDNTVIDIYQLNQADSPYTCKVKETNDNLVKAYQDNIINDEDISRFQMFLQDTPYGPSFGIFCAKGESSERLARLKAQGQCYRGDNDDVLTLPAKENNLNWAVSFDCL